jgi:cytochrome c biogenesis protein CcmG, thiol:disulfide interchange protein DsbE
MGPLRTRRQALLARTLMITLVVAAIGVAAYAVVLAERQPSSSPQQIVPPDLGRGAKAPTFSIGRLGGGPPVTYAAPTPTPVVLQFFASWCPDCLGELRSFATASRTLGHRVRFIGVDANDTNPAAVERLLAAAGDDYPTGVDPYAIVANRYDAGYLPTTVYIDPAGHVVDVAFGAQTTADLEHWAAVAGTD